MDFGRFTERARRVIGLAQVEARKSRNYGIGPPALLLGLLREDGGIAGTILRDEFCLDEADVRALINQGDAPHDNPTNPLPFTPETQKILEMALREALGMGHNYVGTEHILLALCKFPGETENLFQRKCGGTRWKEAVKLEETLRGHKSESQEKVLKGLELQDVISDILTGFKMWRERKVSDCTLDDDDEAFVRWIEAGTASDYL
jgi:ATP-dependent Clp protease ATP-binding subunit ClpC